MQQYFSVTAQEPAQLPPCEQFFKHLADFLDAFEGSWHEIERHPSAWKQFAPSIAAGVARVTAPRRRAGTNEIADESKPEPDMGRRSTEPAPAPKAPPTAPEACQNVAADGSETACKAASPKLATE